MKLLNKLEKKFGNYYLNNLTLILIVGFVVGFLVEVFAEDAVNILVLDPAMVLHGQIWRLITWVIIPPGRVGLLFILTLMFYWFIGRTLEQVWGGFRYNLYIISGILFTDIGVIVTYLVLILMGQTEMAELFSISSGGVGISSYFLCMSMFLAYAAQFPDQMFYTLIFFIPVPIKVKWMAIIDAAYLIYYMMMYLYVRYIPGVVTIIMSFLNFFVFWYLYKGKNGYKKKKRKTGNNKAKKINVGTVTQIKPATRHKCSICGQTELDNSELEFRYCSRCNGNYEYCNNHIFTHEHKK